MFDLEDEDSAKLKKALDEINELAETAADDALDAYERCCHCPSLRLPSKSHLVFIQKWTKGALPCVYRT
jgi:hypothetical protein